jgi:hypothetical protein
MLNTTKQYKTCKFEGTLNILMKRHDLFRSNILKKNLQYSLARGGGGERDTEILPLFGSTETSRCNGEQPCGQIFESRPQTAYPHIVTVILLAVFR